MSLLTRRRVLVVDEIALAGRLVKDAITDAGGTADVAASAEEALAYLRDIVPSAAVVDWPLKGNSATALVQRLMALAVPILLSTEYQPDRLPAGLRLAPTLRKPFSSAELVEALTLLLREPSTGP